MHALDVQNWQGSFFVVVSSLKTFLVGISSLLPQVLRKKSCFHYKVCWLFIFFSARVGDGCNMTSCDWFFPISAANSYSPVYPKWTTERCAVCRWVEDWDYNKIIICNRYFLQSFRFLFATFIQEFLWCFKTTLYVNCYTISSSQKFLPKIVTSDVK
jgi:hypothetical protein